MRDNDREEYEKFFGELRRSLEFGIHNSYGSLKGPAGDLLLFHSAKEEKLVTLIECLAAAPPDQKIIYYAAGEASGAWARCHRENGAGEGLRRAVVLKDAG